jgi:type VI secretion system protein ImpC
MTTAAPPLAAAPLALDPATVDAMIAAVDVAIARQLDAILHHPALQRLEALWRGLAYLVERVPAGSNVEVHLLPCSVDELHRDFAEAAAPLESGLYRVLYAAGYAGPKGRPYAAVIADFAFGPEPVDLALLRRAATVGEALHAPFIASPSPRLLGVESFAELDRFQSLTALLDRPEAEGFRALRELEQARGAALVMPRVLGRAPYEPREDAAFPYREGTPEHGAYLWTSPVYAFAARMVDSFVRYGWCPNILGEHGGGAVDDLPRVEGAGPAEVALRPRAEYELAEGGFVPLAPAESGVPRFLSAPTLRRPRYFGESEEGRAAELNDRLNVQLPYVFVLQRFAHLAHVLHAENLGTWGDTLTIEKELNDFMGQYVAGREVLPAGERGRLMLRKLQVIVRGSEDGAAWKRFEIRMRPAFKFMGAFFTLTVVGRLDARPA